MHTLKQSLALFLVVTLLLGLAGGCSNSSDSVSSNSTASPTSSTSDLETKKENEVSDAGTTTAQQISTIPPEEWKSAYKEVVAAPLNISQQDKEGYEPFYMPEWGEDTFYLLVDIDQNGLPELVRETGIHAYGYSVFYYNQDGIQEINASSDSCTFVYWEGTNIFYTSYGAMGESGENYWKINNGTVTKISSETSSDLSENARRTPEDCTKYYTAEEIIAAIDAWESQPSGD